MRVARGAAAKLEGENERMRQMLRALIAAIDAGETRLFGTVERAERRLRELIDTGTALPEPSHQVQAPRPRARPPHPRAGTWPADQAVDPGHRVGFRRPAFAQERRPTYGSANIPSVQPDLLPDIIAAVFRPALQE